MKIVVTGALGHIGSRLVRDLSDYVSDAHISMIDNLATQRFPALFDLPSHGRFSFTEADVTKVDLLPLLDGAEVVVHLAAMTDAAGSFSRAAELEANNYRATEQVAHACLKTGARLIALSSTSVYGTQASVVTEDCTEEELKPQSPYAETKLKEERLVAALSATEGLRAVVCRFGTIFGISPGMRFHTAVNKFCWQAVMGQPLSVWRTAYDQKRPYLDLADATQAIAFIINEGLFDGRIYNVLTLNATVGEIVELIKTFVPGAKVELVDSPIMNQLSYEVSNKRICDQGFAFGGDLVRGVEQTISLLKAANQDWQ